jgi:hypothetical protein
MMRKTLSLLGVLMLVAVAAQAQEPTQPPVQPGKSKTTAPKATVSKTNSPAATSKGDSALMNTGTNGEPIDVNTATRAELIDAGWGQYADGIIASRPYTNLEQLSDKNIVPRTAFDEGAAKFNVGSQEGADTPMPNQTPSTDGASTDMSKATNDSANATTAVPGAVAPKQDSTATPSR